MPGYLLDTSILIALVDPTHSFNKAADKVIKAMAADDLQFVSAISLGEIRSGVESVLRIHGNVSTNASKTLAEAQLRPLLTITHFVSEEYGKLKSAMIAHHMPKSSKSKRKEHLEDWISHATGQRLAVNENDLWICSQAFERDLHVLTCDADFDRVREAEPRLKLTVLRTV